jgi:hypothetical protein
MDLAAYAEEAVRSRKAARKLRSELVRLQRRLTVLNRLTPNRNIIFFHYLP